MNKNINFKFYNGNDSHDAISSVSEITPFLANSNYDDILQNGSSPAYIHHLSPIRQNIIDWYPFNKDASLLEIGAQSGILTSVFCDKTKMVTATDSNKCYCEANAQRNNKFKNLSLYAGNFLEIEFPDSYDYITFIGSLDAALSDKYITKALSLLKPNGTIIIACQNTYGLKYFSGVPDNNSKKLFEGIQGFPTQSHFCSFSLNGLKKTLASNGLSVQKFYYPVPDYEYPTEIYSDNHLPSSGNIRYPAYSYSSRRVELFNEVMAFDKICEDDMFPIFANSFLVFANR